MGGLGYVHADSLRFDPSDVIVEVGAGPESTPYLARVAHRHGATFRSLDLADGDAAQVLATFPRDRRIRFAYLDSSDWPYPGLGRYGEEVAAAYAARGAAYGEDASAAHHLALAREIEPRAVGGAVVALDDTWWSATGWTGKGRDAVPWLLASGWGLFASHRDGEPEPSGRNAHYTALIRMSAR